MTRISSEQMAEEISKLIWGKREWLRNFSSGKAKRPDHEIERVNREMDVLLQAAADYRRSAERNAA